MPSNWMGVTQSSHKIAFEEALHNSIENSLRSSSVTPSAVFSSLFFTYRPSSASTVSTASDVKPNVDELDSEVDRPVPTSSEHLEQNCPVVTSLPYFHPARPLPTVSSEVRAPLALQTSNGSLQQLQEQRNNAQNENRAAVATNQHPISLLAQQQQFEQIHQARVEQFKQLQKIQAWQQMQKEQQQQQHQQQSVGSRMVIQGPREMRPQHIPVPTVRPSVPNVPRSTSSALIPAHANGMQHNGVIPPIHAAFSLRHDRPLQVANSNGFCKGGKDIRLSHFEHDCTQMISPPPDFVLLALQTVLGRADSAIVISLSLKSLPPPSSSSQALLAQCIGCGEKSIHTFPQLAAHVGIELGIDGNTSRFNSSQLIGTHGRFYMVRDATNPHKLVRGSPTIWYNNNEVERMRMLGSISSANQTTASSSLIRGSMIMVSPPHHHTPTATQEAAVPSHRLMSPSYGPAARPHLKRALSSPTPKNPVEPGKRQYSSYSQDEVVVIQDEPVPKRYLSEERDSWRKVEIPEGFSTLHETKPVIAFLFPQTNLPHFIGDVASVIITSHFAECLQPLSHEAKKRLKIIDHCSLTYSKLLLFSTVQYLVKLGRFAFSVEGLSACLLECRQKFNDENPLNFSDVKSSDILLLSQLAAASSNGMVEVIHCKTSIAMGISDCLQNHRSSLDKYYVLVHINSNDELTFHLFVSGNITRAIEESLGPREGLSSIVSQGLVSLQFSQLRIFLSEVTKQCYTNHATSKLKSFNLNSSTPIQHSNCSIRRNQSSACASVLYTKIQKILNDSSDFEISDFTSLKFLFLVPPSTSHLTGTLEAISNSKIFSEIFKSHSVHALAKQVVVTVEDSSVQRVSSICKQCENTSTLLILLRLDAHLIHDKSNMLDFLNSSAIRQSKNIFHVQCTPFPYLLLTRNSRIPIDNIVCLNKTKNSEVMNIYNRNDELNSLCQSSAIFDPIYEEQRERLCNRYRLLHSSLIVCEILTHQYIASFSMASSASDFGQHKEQSDLNRIASPITNQVTRGLLSHDHATSIVVVRVTSSILATRFCDNLRQARHRLGLDESFEILLYSGDSVAPAIPLSNYFLSILQAYHSADQDWRPSCLNDLAGIPCLIVHVGDQLVSQTLPSSLRYIDCRMAFNGGLDRFHVEQELSLASSLCEAYLENEEKTEIEKSSSPTPANHVSNLRNHNKQNNHALSEPCSESRSASFNWTPSKQNGENGFRNDEKENSESKREDALLDFIGLAMKEADLPADERSHSTSCFHTTPLVILPENVYNLVRNKTGLSLRDLLPHTATRWSEPLHPRLRIQSPLSEETLFYRNWSYPTERNPDFDNTEQITDENRILLVTPSNCQAQQICCEFLRSVHGVISKSLEISIYDDPEESVEVCDGTFRSVLVNNVRRGLSQIVNSCTNCSSSHRFLASDLAKCARSVVARRCRHALTCVKRTKNMRNGALANGNSHSHVEYSLKIQTKEWLLKDDGTVFGIVIPSAQTDKFHFVASEDGSVELVSLRLKKKDDIGVKTPVVSLGVSGVKHGLYNLNVGSESFSHLVLVKACDSDAYKLCLPNHIIVVLPAEFDFLGRGALKYAAQILFEHFYSKEKDFAMINDAVWPFYLLVDDDVVTFTTLQHGDESQIDNFSSSWIDISFLEMMKTFESIATFDMSAVGFRPWSQTLPACISRGELFLDNYLIESCVESCIFLNCKSANKVKYSRTKFTNEDVDWSLRAAAIGLNLYRFENIAMLLKVVEPLNSDVSLDNTSSSLVTIADSEFVPLYHHPALLLEKYLPKCAPLMFPGARGHPENPVLCVDCCLSLGNQVCIQFASSDVTAKPWAVNRCKKYGGLIVSSPNSNIRPEFLDGFQFISGAVVCVIGTDRSSLRQTVVSLRLESAWHFRLTDEFQTANHSILGGVPMRPWYFLTGGKKES